MPNAIAHKPLAVAITKSVAHNAIQVQRRGLQCVECRNYDCPVSADALPRAVCQYRIEATNAWCGAV